MDILVTKRLTLRPPLEVDADDIADFISNWNVSRMLARVPHPYFRADAMEWIERISKNVDAGEDLVFTMHRERLIGAVSIEGLSGTPELGYWLAEPFWGKGFATEGAAALIRHAFSTRAIERIESAVFKENNASFNVQEKLGFKLAGNGLKWSSARNEMVPEYQTVLTRADFLRADAGRVSRGVIAAPTQRDLSCVQPCHDA